MTDHPNQQISVSTQFLSNSKSTHVRRYYTISYLNNAKMITSTETLKVVSKIYYITNL